MKKSFSINAKIWRWPGYTGWHFVTFDKKLSAEIRKKYPRGFVKVVSKIGKTKWSTSLFPHKINKNINKDIEYLLCINKKIQKEEGLFEGDDVKISVELV